MPFVAAPNIVKLDFHYTLNGQPAMNRIMVDTFVTNPKQSDCQTLANMGATWWLGSVQPLVPPQTILRQTQATSLAVQNGPQATFSAGLPAPGTLGQTPLPGNCAFCVSLRSGLTGRSARGRWYWCGLTEPQTTDNDVNAGVVTSIVSAIDGLLNAIKALSMEPVIVSYVTNKAPRVGGPVYFIINDALAVDNVVDSQRGRLH